MASPRHHADGHRVILEIGQLAGAKMPKSQAKARRAGGRRPGKSVAKPKKAGNLRQRFVREYLTDENATQAAVRAGYSAKPPVRRGIAC